MAEASTTNVTASAQPGLLAQLSGTLVNGVNRYIDAEIADRAGQVPTTGDVTYTNPKADPSQPQDSTTLRDTFVYTGAVVGAGVAIAVFAIWFIARG